MLLPTSSPNTKLYPYLLQSNLEACFSPTTAETENLLTSLTDKHNISPCLSQPGKLFVPLRCAAMASLRQCRSFRGRQRSMAGSFLGGIPAIANLFRKARTQKNSSFANIDFSDICKILLAIILPPVGVFLERGCGADFLINILLTILGKPLNFCPIPPALTALPGSPATGKFVYNLFLTLPLLNRLHSWHYPRLVHHSEVLRACDPDHYASHVPVMI